MRVRKFTSSKLFKLFLVLIVVFAGYQILVRPRLSQSQPVVETPLPAKPAKATAEINKSFNFEAIVVQGKGTEEVVFTVASAELKDQIKVKGEPRGVSKGDQYLLLRLEIENETTDKLALTPSDFIRLLDEEDKKYAPDFHNAVVIIDPLSVRKDLVSFIVDAKLKSFKLLVGELEEEKETVEINF